MKSIRLKPGKERSLLRRHPWVFDGAVARGGADSGETVRVESAEGQFLAWAAFSPVSKIRARAWSFDEKQRIDAAFFDAAVARSVRARAQFDIPSNALRLVHGESDGLPGLIVDQYGDTLVAQFSSAGVERFKQALADALRKATGLTKLYERSDSSSRGLEGLPEVKGWLRGGPAGGQVSGQAGDPAADASSAQTDLQIEEHSWILQVDIANGHKTGFYLDQRDSRRRFADYTRRLGFKTVLNCYCYTGGFTVAALAGMRAAGLAGGASGGENTEGHITSIDSSAPALQKAAQNVALNGFGGTQVTWLDADVNASLRQFGQARKSFDAIVLDPPKLAPTVAHAERAARAYKDINRLALKLLKPGGVLFTYSCSGGISADLFHKIVAGAALDAGVDGYIVERMGGAPDHPMTLEFPEGEYLKGLVVVRK